MDRLKYFLLGLLFLVVAGVIAFDRATSDDPISTEAAERDDGNAARVTPRPVVEPPEARVRPPIEVDPLPPRKPPTHEPAPAQPPPVRPKVDPTPPPKPKPVQPRDVEHIVQKGDSLGKIAQRYYNTRKGVAWIVAANQLRDANTIFINQKLVIPARKESLSTSATSKKKAAPPPRGKVPGRYVVRAGDGDLYSICRRFYGRKGEGARVARIMDLNGLWSADVEVGTTLKLLPR